LSPPTCQLQPSLDSSFVCPKSSWLSPHRLTEENSLPYFLHQPFVKDVSFTAFYWVMREIDYNISSFIPPPVNLLRITCKHPAQEIHSVFKFPPFIKDVSSNLTGKSLA